MSVQQFCLRWNNHQPNFISVCSSLLHNGTLVDVTLAAEGNQLQAHKIVLSACSSYFQSLFTMNPCQHPIVILKDVQYDHLRTMVDFMYYGEVNVSQDQLPHILKTAEMLKIKGLAEMPTDPANLIRSDSKSANDTTELVGTAASTSAPTSNSGGAGGGNTNSNGGGLVNSGSTGLSGTLWSNSESQFHAQQQPQQHQSQQSAQHQTQPQQHHQQLQQQQQHHNQQQQHQQQQQLHTQLQNSQTQISQHHQQQQQQQQQQQHHHHHQQIRRTPSPLGAGASPAARRKRIRKSSNNGSGERNNSDDQHNSGLETGPGGGLTLSQMSQMSFGGGASTSGLSGLATHSLHTAKLLKEAANNDMETHPQDSDSLDDTHGHVHIQIKPEVDITGIQQSIPLDISGATTPSEHDAPNTQSAHSECTAAFINTEAATDDNNMNVSLNQKQQQQQSMAMGSKRNRVLTRQPRVKRDSDSLSSHHVSPEPSTCSKSLDTDLLPSTTSSSSSISGQTRTLFVSTQGHHRQHHLLTVPPRIERHSSEPAPSLSPSSPHLLSVPQNTPFLIKQHSDPLPPSQYSASHLSGVVGVMGNTLTNPFAPLHRQYSHPLASSGIAAGYVATSGPLQPSQHISLPEAIYASTSPPPVGSSQYIVPIQNISHQHNTSSSSSAINVYPTIERYSPTTTSPTKVLMSAAMGEQEQATITNVASCNATTVNSSTTVTTTTINNNNSNSSNLNPKFRFSRSLQTHSSSTSSSTSGIHTSAGSSSFEQISHLRVRTEELQRSVSSPQTSREMITLENPRSSHCPVIRPGPALGCNFCWNTIDGHGRILRRKTKYHCPECQTNLCIVPCFQEYHERVNNETSTATTKQSTASTMHNTNNSNNQTDNRTRQHYTKTETI